jgi:exodeoxyribonuclease VII large subunit
LTFKLDLLMPESRVFTVSTLTRQIKNLLEDNFPTVWVEGEISNYRPHYSGHLYFTLKDIEAQISCVMWRSRASTITQDIADGMKVRVLGNIRLYEKAGRYQLDTVLIQPAGIGELQMRFEALKQKLQAEGLFDPQHKKTIPEFPQSIGIITSPTGAAIKDILAVLKRVSPSTEVVIRGVRVQGDGAANEIADAIDCFNKYGMVDMLIIGRGGGSLEDLWPFNEEIVARAIFNSVIPVISAVGHEIDFTIADFVADARAATPSAAAESFIPRDMDIKETLLNINNIIQNLFNEYINQARNNINNILRSYAFRRPEDIIQQHALRVDELTHRLLLAGKHRLTSKNEEVLTLQKNLFSLNPDNVLARGYSMLFKDDRLISSVHNVDVDDRIIMKVKDGKISGKVLEKSEG